MILQTSVFSGAVTIVAAFLGLLGGILSRVIWHRVKTRTKRKKLRAAILAEITTPREAIETAASVDSKVEASEIRHSTFPNRVYTTQTADVGLLSSDETKYVVEYYSIVEVANEQLSPSEEYGDPQDFFETALSVKSARDDAEYVLEAHARWFGRSRFLLRKWKDGDRYWRDDTDTNDSDSTVDDQGREKSSEPSEDDDSSQTREEYHSERES